MSWEEDDGGTVWVDDLMLRRRIAMSELLEWNKAQGSKIFFTSLLSIFL